VTVDLNEILQYLFMSTYTFTYCHLKLVEVTYSYFKLLTANLAAQVRSAKVTCHQMA
jgi:hypothetical protein